MKDKIVRQHLLEKLREDGKFRRMLVTLLLDSKGDLRVFFKEYRVQLKLYEYELKNIAREDLSNLFVNLDLRKSAFLKRMSNQDDLMNQQLFSQALEKYDGKLPRLR